jgi:hypothetical protein
MTKDRYMKDELEGKNRGLLLNFLKQPSEITRHTNHADHSWESCTSSEPPEDENLMVYNATFNKYTYH